MLIQTKAGVHAHWHAGWLSQPILRLAKLITPIASRRWDSPFNRTVGLKMAQNGKSRLLIFCEAGYYSTSRDLGIVV